MKFQLKLKANAGASCSSARMLFCSFAILLAYLLREEMTGEKLFLEHAMEDTFHPVPNGIYPFCLQGSCL